MFGSDIFHLSIGQKTVIFFVCLAMALIFLLIGSAKEMRAEATAQLRPGRRRRMIAIGGMFVCGIGFIGFAGAYFWPVAETSTPKSAQPGMAAALPITEASKPLSDASVLLVIQEGQIRIYNLESDPIYLWGTKLDPGIPDMVTEPRVIVPTAFYYLPLNIFESLAKEIIGDNNDELLPLSIYLKNKSGNKFTSHSYIHISIHNGVVNTTLQQLGISQDEWYATNPPAAPHPSPAPPASPTGK